MWCYVVICKVCVFMDTYVGTWVNFGRTKLILKVFLLMRFIIPDGYGLPFIPGKSKT